jgi:hypothetical protein
VSMILETTRDGKSEVACIKFRIGHELSFSMKIESDCTPEFNFVLQFISSPGGYSSSAKSSSKQTRRFLL